MQVCPADKKPCPQDECTERWCWAIDGECRDGAKPEPQTTVLHYDDTPPSLNALSGHHHQGKYAGAKKRWEGIFAMMFMAGKVPRNLSRVEVKATLRFPDRRSRDEGNFRFMLEKALGDALVKAGWLPDDTHDHYEFGRVTFSDERGPKLTTLEVTYE